MKRKLKRNNSLCCSRVCWARLWKSSSHFTRLRKSYRLNLWRVFWTAMRPAPTNSAISLIRTQSRLTRSSRTLNASTTLSWETSSDLLSFSILTILQYRFSNSHQILLVPGSCCSLSRKSSVLLRSTVWRHQKEKYNWVVWMTFYQ